MIDAGHEHAVSGRRAALAEIDRNLIRLLAERARLARELGRTKRGLGLPILDPAQEAVVVRRAADHAVEVGLPEEAVRTLFWTIIRITREAQSSERGE